MGGHQRNKSIYLGLLGGMLFQSTIEVMDGFSEGWGFSLTDMSANVAGLSCFIFNKILGRAANYPQRKQLVCKLCADSYYLTKW